MITWTTTKGSKIELQHSERKLIISVNGNVQPGGFVISTHPTVGDCLRGMIGNTVIPVPTDRLAEVRGMAAAVENECKAYAAELVASSERHEAIERIRTRGFA